MKYRIELVKHIHNTDQILLTCKDEFNTFGLRFDSDWPVFMVDSLKDQLISEFEKNDKYFWINKLHIIIDDLKNFLEDKMRAEETYESEDKRTQCKNCKNFDGHTTTKQICVECRLNTVSGTRYNFQEK